MNNELVQQELKKRRSEFLVKRNDLIQNRVEKERLALVEKNATRTTKELVSKVSEISKIVGIAEEIADKVEKNQESTHKVTGDLSVKNFPEVQRVSVENLPKVQDVSIENLPEIQKVELHNKDVRVANFPDVQSVEVLNQKESTKIENFPKVQDVRLINPVDELTVKNLPLAEGEEASKKADPTKYLPVRLTNGKTFVGGINSSAMAGSGGGSVSFVKPDGTPERASIDNDGHVKVDVETMPPVTVETGDIEIGAVEIKNSTDDTRATVGADGLEVEVKKSALPSGAATSANQTTANGYLLGIGGFLTTAYDNITQTQATLTDTWTFKLAAVTVATITITYTDATKAVISTVVKT